MTVETLSPTNQKIYKVLQRAGQPLSAYELLDKLRAQGVRSPPTVYRALEKLQNEGLVHRVESLNAFVACRHACADHHAQMSPFAICTKCGTVRELCEPTLERALKQLGQEFLGQVDHKVFEVSGLCHACCEKSTKPKRKGAHV